MSHSNPLTSTWLSVVYINTNHDLQYVMYVVSARGYIDVPASLASATESYSSPGHSLQVVKCKSTLITACRV